VLRIPRQRLILLGFPEGATFVPIRLLKADRLIRNAGYIIPIGFGLVLAAALAVALLLARAREADNEVVRAFEVQRAARNVLISVIGAETGQRGFLLTSNPSYLQPFDQSRADVSQQLDTLEKLTAGDPVQSPRATGLRPLITRKFEEMAETIAFARAGRQDDALVIVNSDTGLQLMKSVRNELTTILDTEREQLAKSQERAGRTRYSLAGLTGLALLLATTLAAILAISARHAVKGLVERTRELEEESRLRHEAEATVRQAVKMEAVGQLTGGVAHDFNNLLTIIAGNLDTIKRQLGDLVGFKTVAELGDKLKKPVDSALQGAKRAATLTQRLLAFSRRQALEPVRLDVNKLVTGMLDLLRRSLGEQISVETVLAGGLWPAYADGHQLENVLLNLALNAKAAMPDGGCLTIETANTYLDEAYARRFGDVEAGQYVVLCVTDTGTGIPKDILDKVFEPFFTTKGHGEGSGLGLAMVHGFVKQSGGHVRIYSEEGQGTTVKIYLPRLTGAEEMRAVPAGKPAADTLPAPVARASETILLVEDNEGVREYAKGALEGLGYTVLEASNADEALRLIKKRPSITLLFTDVVLPGSTSGRELADAVRRKYPGLPVLYTTGYTRNAIVHQGRLDPDVHLLNKPYTQRELARKLRELIDAAG
jgi:signal transduction histidine kinase/CheY-like chemotaxis protein